MWAAMEVLRGKRKPMTVREIHSEIRERDLAETIRSYCDAVEASTGATQ